VVNLSRLAQGSRADGTSGLLRAQPDRHKLTVLVRVMALAAVLAARPVSRLAAPGAVTGINWGHTSDQLDLPQREVCPLTSVIARRDRCNHVA